MALGLGASRLQHMAADMCYGLRMSGSRRLNHCPRLRARQANQRGLELLLRIAASSLGETQTSQSAGGILQH